MRRITVSISASFTPVFVAIAIAATVLGCGKAVPHPVVSQNSPSRDGAPSGDGAVSPFASYRDIPGVTAEEIAAIEALRQTVLQKENSSLVYGMMLSTETFRNENGEIGGYTALICDWLTELFGIRFMPAIYEWGDIVQGLRNYEIDFCGEFTPTEERRKIWFMTEGISERSVKFMRIVGSAPLSSVQKSHPPRYAFLDGSITAERAAALIDYPFETVFVQDTATVYAMLKSGEIDAFIEDDFTEAAFDIYGDVVTEDFFPLAFSTVAMTTFNPALAPVISVVTKAQRNGAIPYLNKLYNQGYEAYKRHKFFILLDDKEKAYLQNTVSVPMAARSFNYPVDFYNSYEKKWDGLVFDILHKVEELTGLTFEVINEQQVNLSTLLGMVREGKAHIIPELLFSNERMPHYLWMEHHFIQDQYALLSKSHYPNVNVNEIPNKRVGVIKDTARAELFRSWFPNAVNVIEYSIDEDSFRALERGEIDLVMASKNRLLAILNYYELSDYKANFLFDFPYESTFGFNKDQTILCSIMDKALPLIDTNMITEQWLTKTYDFRARLVEAQRPWLIGAAILSLAVFALLLALLYRSRVDRKRLAREEAQVMAREAEERTKIMLDSTPLSCTLITRDNKFIDCNKEAERLFGVSSKQEFIDRFFEFSREYQPDGEKSQDKAYRLFKQTFDEGYAHVEWVHFINGEVVPCEVILVRVKYYDDYIIAGYTRDLRNLKEAQAKVREADERTQLMIEYAPYIVMLWDRNLQILDCNQEAIRTFGLSSKKEYIERFFDLSPEYQPNGMTSLEMAQKALEKSFNGTGYDRIEWTMKHPATGEEIPFETTIVRIKYKNGYAVLTYALDMRERNAAIAEMREADERARIIFDFAPFASSMFDKNGVLLDCNQETVKMYGIPNKEFYLTNSLKLLPEYQPNGVLSVEDAVEKFGVAFEKGYNQFEHMHKRLNGEPLPVEITVVRVKYRDEYILASYLRDLTEQKTMAQLSKQQAEAEAANRAKSSFLAAMSHEIRTPMNAILGITEIQLQNKKLLPDTRDALNIIYNSGYSLLGIINDLLDLSKIEAGKLELIDSRYETVSLIYDTINLNTTRIGSKPIEFKLNVDEDMPFELIGDELRVKQILNNLLSNAFKYTDSGEVSLSFSARTTGEKVTLTIVVRDTGQGMTGEQIRGLFDAYSRFNMKANRFVEGTGLGMNIVQHLVNMMSGDISVDSAPGEGTEVTVHLIQRYANPARLGSEVVESLKGFRMAGISKVKKAQIVREYMPYGKVLVVDDMETNLYVAKGFLLPYELKVETALSGLEAIKKIERGDEYDIVFMDHMMPVMDGIETVREIRGRGYTRPIIALTANAVAGQADMFMANGFDGFISKPIDIREMNASLNKYVRDRQPAEVVEAARAAYGDGIVADTEPQLDPELAKIFTHDAEKVIAILQGYEAKGSYEGADLQMYIINVHALKSALANIGETKLSGLARDLEEAGRERNTAYITDETPAFLKGLRAVVDKLNVGKEEHRAGEATEEDLVYLSKMLTSIKEACAEYDVDAALAALAELKRKPWPGEYGELLDTISEHLLHSDFDEAEAVCAARLSVL